MLRFGSVTERQLSISTLVQESTSTTIECAQARPQADTVSTSKTNTIASRGAPMCRVGSIWHPKLVVLRTSARARPSGDLQCHQMRFHTALCFPLGAALIGFRLILVSQAAFGPHRINQGANITGTARAAKPSQTESTRHPRSARAGCIIAG